MNTWAPSGLCPHCVGRISVLGTGDAGSEQCPLRALPSFGDYELLEEAGRGSMGVVYRARHRGLSRVVALKMILSGPFASEAERQRFELEARAAAQLDHPNIVPIHEFGERDGRQFYAMRWIEGGALEMGMGEEKAARLIATVSRAVHHAHQRGVLHRDLKPGNILLDPAGEPYVSDFGLARWLDETSTATASGSPVGTPAYMSPEQASGSRGITTASDIWSLGAILYQLLTGRTVFRSPSTIEVIAQAREGLVTPVHHWMASVSRDLETICLKCLRKEPTARYASASELADDLERWLRNEPIWARPMSHVERARLWVRRHPMVTAATGLTGLLFLSGLIGVLSQWHRAERERDRAERQLLQLHLEKALRANQDGDLLVTLSWMASALAMENASSPRIESYRHFIANTLRECPLPEEIWFFDHEVRDIAFSNDGRWLAASASPGELLIAQLDGAGRKLSEQRFLAGGRQIAFATDGRTLYNAASKPSHGEGALSVIELSGFRVLTTIPLRSQLHCLDATPDGVRFATASENGTVEIHDASTGKLITAALSHAGDLTSAEFNPAGDRLVTVCNDQTVRLWKIPAGDELGKLTGSTFAQAHFSPDGKRLVVASRREHTAQLYDAETLSSLGPPLRHDDYVQDAVFSPDGELLATAGNDHVARIWNTRTGQPATPPLRHANELLCLQFSADGRRLATGGLDPAARVWDAATGEPVTPWLRHGGAILSVKFSPDGGHLLTSSRDGTARLWPLPASTTSPKQLADQPTPVWRTTFSDDGKRAFCASSNVGRAYRTTDWQPLTPIIQCDNIIDHERFSADGKHLLIGSRDHQVSVWPWNRSKPIASYRHADSITGVEWMPDSKRIISTSDSKHDNFVLWDALTGQVERVFTNAYGVAHTVAVSADGRWLVGGSDARLTLWNASTGQRVWLGAADRGNVNALRFSPDGGLLASGNTVGNVQLQRVATGELVIPALPHGACVRDIQFAPDGKAFVVVSDNRVARVWSSLTGKPLLPPLKLPRGVEAAGFSHDGHWLLVANERELQVWDALTGVPVSLVKTFDESLSGASATENTHLLGVSVSGRVVNFQMNDLDWSDDQIVRATRLLSGVEMDVAGGLHPTPPAGEQASSDHRREAEATWLWLRAQLNLIRRIEGR